MNLSSFNKKLRQIFSNFVSDGFLQADIAKVTFGNNRQDQLKMFLGGRDVGGAPLNHILDSFGFELHIVPVIKKNTEDMETISEISENAFEALQLILVDYLERTQSRRNRKSNIIIFADNILKNI